MQLSFTKSIQNLSKFGKELMEDTEVGELIESFTVKGTAIEINFSESLNQTQIDYVTAFVNDFVEVDITADLKAYVESAIQPFVEDLLYRIQAENIEMGITAAGKTYETAAFFCSQVTLPGKVRSISIRDAIATNSLTVVIDILNYYIADETLYDDLAPYITQARLTQWRDEVIEFLS